jgi:hypothetical protein
MINVNMASLSELENELEKCNKLWSRYSCDCLGFEMTAIENKIKQLTSHEHPSNAR